MSYLPNPGIPKPLYDLLCWSDYTRGKSKYSATDLIRSPQIVQLTRRHAKKLPPVDPRENTYRVLGSAVHNILEKLGKVNPEDWQIIEERLHATIDEVAISGQVDIHCTLEGGILTDYKHCKVSVLKFDVKEEWVVQQNIYAFLLRQHGYEVTESRVMAIFRDWSQSGIGGKYRVTISTDGKKVSATKNSDYPDWPCEIISIPLWSNEKVEALIKERIRLHEIAETLPDEELPPCTPEERWKRDKFVVRRRGHVKGKTKSFSEECAAVAYAADLNAEEKKNGGDGDEFVISRRPGIPYRCAFYCDVGRSGFCHQIKREGLELEIDGETVFGPVADTLSPR